MRLDPLPAGSGDVAVASCEAGCRWAYYLAADTDEHRADAQADYDLYHPDGRHVLADQVDVDEG